MTGKETMKFTVPSDDKENMRRILRKVYEALTEKGYNPINQIARSMICKIDRDELMQVLVREYLFEQE